MSRRARGDGRVYLRGTTYWIQYNLRGKTIRESAHSDKENIAARLLRSRLGEVMRGKLITPTAEKVTLADMRTALLDDYELNGNRTTRDAKRSADYLVAYFEAQGITRAIDITKEKVTAYADARKEQVSNASVNREMAYLRRMYNVMVEAGRLSRDHVPAVPHLQEAEPRQGFLEPAEFARLRDALPEHLKGPAAFLYAIGWRLGAMQTLEWARDVELEFSPDGDIIGGTITLQAANAKNKRSLRLPLKGDLLEVIRRSWQRRIPECPFVFHYDGGKPIGDFRKAWRNACRAAGLDRLLRHDMRRSSARNLIRSGTPERVVMEIMGYRTRSMLDRYNIVSGADVAAALERVSDYTATKAAEPPKVVPLRKAS
jgi:integrase